MNTTFAPVPVSTQTAVDVAVGPYSLNVMVPPAGPPAVVGLMTGVPGWFAVPVRCALSVIDAPGDTVATGTLVVISGVTGLTVKHSPAAKCV